MRKLLSWILTAAVCLLFGACANPQNAQQPEKYVGEKTPIVIWLVEQENDFYSKLAEAFERENPSIDLTLEEIPVDEYNSRFENEAGTFSGPDVALVRNPRWLMEGRFFSLENTIRKYAIPAGDFNLGALSRDCVYNEKIYCLGTTTSAYILIYNKDLFDEFGENYPRQVEPMSTDDYAALAQRFHLKASQESVWGTAFPLPYLWMDRQTHLSSNGREIYRFANDEPTVHTYQLLLDLCASQAAPCLSSEDSEAIDTSRLFTQGKLATLITDISSTIREIEESGIRWGAAIVPTESGSAAPWTTAWTDGFGVPTSNHHPEEALKFLAFLANRGSQLRVDAGQIPLNMDLTSEWAGQSQPRGQVVKILATAREVLFVPDYEKLTEPIEPAVRTAIKKGIPAKDALDETAFQLQEFLDRSWAWYDRLNQVQ